MNYTNGHPSDKFVYPSSERKTYRGEKDSSSFVRPSENEASQNDFAGELIKVSGILEIYQDYGVLRQKELSSENLPKDVYVSQSQIRRFNLRMADQIEGYARPPKEGERYLSLLRVETVEGKDPEKSRERPFFDKLTPIFPDKRLSIETKKDVISTRLIDIVAPIGKGTRGLIVSPPKAGKTIILKEIANGITSNFKNISLSVVLIGERPEEVTDMQRSVKGDVFASNFDQDAEHQIRIAEMALERAKRLAERGNDVVILMDSITRLARAYNLVVPPSGRTLSGGIDPTSLYPPKHFFGAARNFEEGGSLTIVATALVDTGSKMDDVIYEEFKGTGNMELHLNRSLANRGIFPSIDIINSGTRNQEKLFSAKEMENVYRLRRMIDLLDKNEVTELVISRIKKTENNKEFLETLHENK